MDTLEQDFKRFQKLDTWYKNIPLDGLDFYVYHAVGEQPNSGFDPQVEVGDMSGSHWHFSEEKPEGVRSVTVRLGPFLRGVEGRPGNKYAWGIWTIREIAGEATFDAWIATNYPQWIGTVWGNYENISNPLVHDLFNSETNKYYDNLCVAMEQY